MKMGMSKRYWWAVASLVVMIVGAFGPWAKVLGFFTISGTDDGRDGWVVVGAAVAAAVVLLLYVRVRRRWLLAIPLLAGCLGAVTAGYDISDISSGFSGTLGAEPANTEWGIYVALLGSVSLIFASLALVLGTKQQVHAPTAKNRPDPVV